jgi:hypothetical protein
MRVFSGQVVDIQSTQKSERQLRVRILHVSGDVADMISETIWLTENQYRQGRAAEWQHLPNRTTPFEIAATHARAARQEAAAAKRKVRRMEQRARG